MLLLLAGSASEGDEPQQAPPAVPQPDEPMAPLFGQYFVLPSDEAVQARMAKNTAAGVPITEQTMTALEEALRSNHALAPMYFKAAKLHKDWLDKTKAEGRPVPDFQLVLLTNREARDAGVIDPKVHLHRTENPTSDGKDAVALIWINDEGEVNPLEDESGVGSAIIDV